jgi:hypothetical protein
LNKECSLAAFVDHRGELGEEVFRVVRAGGGLRVILNAQHRGLSVAHAFDGAIIEVDVGDLNIARKARWIDRKTVILAGDGHLAVAQVFDGLVAAAMAELELEGLASVGMSEDLMSQTDGKNGLHSNQLLHLLVDVVECGGIAGAVGEKDAIRILCEHVCGTGGGGNYIDTEARLAQAAQDVSLHAEVIGYNVMPGWRKVVKGTSGAAFTILGRAGDIPLTTFSALRIPDVGFAGCDLLHEVAALHWSAAGSELHSLVRAQHLAGDDGSHGAAGSEMLRQCACINTLNAGDVPFLEPRAEILSATPVTGHRAKLLDNKAAHMRTLTFEVERIHAVVPDLRVGHRDNLTAIRRIGEHLLIAGHGSVKTNFAGVRGFGAKRRAFKHPAIFEGEEGFFHQSAACAIDRTAEVPSAILKKISPKFQSVRASVWKMPCLIQLFALFLCFAMPLAAATRVTRYHDEAGGRHLTLTETDSKRVEVLVRWNWDPGSTMVWTGQGEKRESGLLFAAAVEDETQDRGPFFTAKVTDTKMVVFFRTEKPDQPDPGIRGEFRRISEEKWLQLAKKEFQTANTRLESAWKNTLRDGRTDDKALVQDWKLRWPKLRELWMKNAYIPPTPPTTETKPGLLEKPTTTIPPEKDGEHWIKLAQATMLAYSFNEQRVDVKNDGGWDGEYDDGFGGHVSIRTAKDGRLRVSLSCTRGNEAQGSDLNIEIPNSALRQKGGKRYAEITTRPPEAESPESPKNVRVMLRREGGGLWVDVSRPATAVTQAAWMDGIYRWSPVPPPPVE